MNIRVSLVDCTNGGTKLTTLFPQLRTVHCKNREEKNKYLMIKKKQQLKVDPEQLREGQKVRIREWNDMASAFHSDVFATSKENCLSIDAVNGVFFTEYTEKILPEDRIVKLTAFKYHKQRLSFEAVPVEGINEPEIFNSEPPPSIEITPEMVEKIVSEPPIEISEKDKSQIKPFAVKMIVVDDVSGKTVERLAPYVDINAWLKINVDKFKDNSRGQKVVQVNYVADMDLYLIDNSIKIRKFEGDK